MALYISRQNQETLWNVIHKNKSMSIELSRFNHEDKIKWFQSIIEKFYKENQYNNLNQNDINLLNKNTILFMINTIRQQSSQPAQTFSNKQFDTNYGEPIIKNNKKDAYFSEFEQRQKEYNAMSEKKAPDAIDFTENIETDEAIVDMKELLEKHKRDRELDVKNYQNTSKLTQNQEIQRLTIDNSSNIQIKTQNIDNENEPIERKSVSWSKELETEFNYKERIIVLETKYNEVLENLEKIKKENEEILTKYENLQKRYKRSHSL